MTPSPQSLLSACAESILAVDPETLTILAANPSAESLLGLPLSELIGRQISDFEVGLQDLFFWEEVRAGSRYGYNSVEGEYRHHSGHLLSVRKSVRLLEEDGQAFYVVSVHDITARRLIEEETALANSLLVATLESTVDGIVVTDISGVVQHYNRRFTQQWQVHGQPPVAQVGFAQMLPLLPEPALFQNWVAGLYADPLKEGKTECPLLDGRYFEVSSRPQRYKDRPIGRVFSFHDITSLKAAETQLIAARDAAQAASRAKSEFLSHMSHELRTPLNAILGFSQVLEDELAPPNKALVQHISKAGLHLLDLINEVLDLASIEAGKLRLELQEVDLADIISDTLSLMSPLAASQGITLSSPPLPLGRFFASADPRRLRQMLFNLVSNAIKYNREQGKVEVTILASRPEYWRLVVSDTGVGIGREEQEKLFEPFTRVGENQTRIEGTGIGLAFTRKLARMMHGQVGLESELGVGSRFWIELPCAGAQERNPLETKPSAGATLLYIEDDMLSQKLFATVLQRKRPDFQLLLAGSGKEGLALAQTRHPALILLDQQLPDMTGRDVFAVLRADERTSDIPVFALSGNASEADVEAALAAGFSRYLTKPLQVDAALAAIDALLGGGEPKPN